jgi:hypothetical protein
MSAKELMTWSGGRWHKKVPIEYRAAAGKTHVTVSPRMLRMPATKEGSRNAANAYWVGLVEQWHSVPSVPGPTHWAKEREARSEFYQAKNDHESAQEVESLTDEQMCAEFVDSMADELVLHRLGVSSESIKRSAIWADRLRQSSIAPVERTIGSHVKLFLAFKESEVEGGKIKASRWGSMKAHLEHLVVWAGGNAVIDDLTSAKLLAFYAFLQKSKGFSSYYKRDIFATTKEFIAHICDLELIPTPKNLRSKQLVFVKDPVKPEVFAIADLITLLSRATERTTLYILLAMNCGFTQVDISDLSHSELHLSERRIIRKRSKTERKKNVPTVNYLLWSKTAALLKKCATTTGELVLLTDEQRPLKQESLVNGKHTKSDNIKSAWVRLLNKLQISAKDRKTFTDIRNTSSTLLEDHAEFSRYAQHFLGHSPKTVAETHYVIPSQRRFDEAVKWLGKQYGL